MIFIRDLEKREARTLKHKPILMKSIKENQEATEIGEQNVTLSNVKNIGIISLSKGAGASFVTMNLAKAIASYKVPVAVLEPPLGTPYLFDTLGLAEKLNEYEEGDRFYSYAHMISSGSDIERDKETIYDSIAWFIPDARIEPVESWDALMMLKLLNTSKKSYINIIDIGSNFHHVSIQESLDSMDLTIVVVDPFPTSVIHNEKKCHELLDLKEKGHNIIFVFNKYNKGVNRKMILDYLSIKPVASIPYISPELVYKSVFDCMIPYNNGLVKEQLEESFSFLLKTIVPKDNYKKYHKKSKLGFFK